MLGSVLYTEKHGLFKVRSDCRPHAAYVSGTQHLVKERLHEVHPSFHLYSDLTSSMTLGKLSSHSPSKELPIQVTHPRKDVVRLVGGGGNQNHWEPW